jgi:hypothetical protein
MNRWRQRLSEIGILGETLKSPMRPDVQIVQNVQNVQNSPACGHFEHSEQFEHAGEGMAKSDAADVRASDIRSRACPEAFSPERWERLREGVARFAAEWADKAMSLGWSIDELFAVAEPFASVALQGAAWFVGDSTVTAVTADAITLRTVNGATQRIYRKRDPIAEPNEEPCL